MPTITKKPHVCAHDPGLTNEEEAAMQWLSQMLGKMSEVCSPEHTRRSVIAHAAIAKVFKKLHTLHDLVHAQEAEIASQDAMMAGLVGLPHQLGLVGDEDFN